MITPAKDEAAIEAILAGPGAGWVFKHSSTCGISSAARDEVESYAAAHPDEPVAMVVVQQDRPLSNWIASRLGRVHQSPQLFLLRDGAVAWAASHWSITAAAMAAARGD